MTEKGLGARIYYGVPRFVGALFRATKTPSIILLIGLIGVPFAISAYLTAYAVQKHSTLPLNLFIVGYLQFRIESDPSAATSLPPNFAQLLGAMTPEQKEQGKEIFEWFTMFILTLVIATIWWFVNALRFLANRANLNTS
jgi:hypothetical protein